MKVVITGGTGALGTAVVSHALEQGFEVVVPEFTSSVPGAWPFASDVDLRTGMDLTNVAAVDALYGSVEDLWASVHCAGGFAWGSIEDVPYARMWAMNAQTAFLCSRAAVRRLKAQGRGGRLVSVASRQALHPMLGANTVAYTMSKAAVAAMTASLAAEVGSDGILVNAVAPGILDTSANREAMPEADSSAWVSPEALARVIGGLIAPGQQVTTGAVIPVYGAGGAGG